jgi:hypothetical protein
MQDTKSTKGRDVRSHRSGRLTERHFVTGRDNGGVEMAWFDQAKPDAYPVVGDSQDWRENRVYFPPFSLRPKRLRLRILALPAGRPERPP